MVRFEQGKKNILPDLKQLALCSCVIQIKSDQLSFIHLVG